MWLWLVLSNILGLIKMEARTELDAPCDDDDPVVHEVDVFLSHSLSDKLFLFQYPLCPTHTSYDPATMSQVKVKPNQKKVAMDLTLKTVSANYSDSKGENIANYVDMGSGSTEPYYPSGYMDKLTLNGKCSAEEDTGSRYALCLLKENELHMTPINGALQLRPSFEYLDHFREGERKSKQTVEESETETEEEEAKPVTVSFARQDGKDSASQMDEEKWKVLQPIGFEHPKADKCRGMLFCENERELSVFNISPEQYMNDLLPLNVKIKSEEKATPNDQISLSLLKQLPLQDQIKQLLLKVDVLPFREICNLLSLSAGPLQEEALSCLPQVAVLVNGCWVVKSRLIYNSEYISPSNNVDGDVMCQVRDYILYKFSSSRVITRKDVLENTFIPQEELLDILKGLAEQIVSKGWKFKYEEDTEFLLKYPQIVASQEELWNDNVDLLDMSQSVKVNKQPARVGAVDRKRKVPYGKKRVIKGRRTKRASESETDPNVAQGVEDRMDTSETQAVIVPSVQFIKSELPDVLCQQSELDSGTASTDPDSSNLKEWLDHSVEMGIVSLEELREQLKQLPEVNPLRGQVISDEVLIRSLAEIGIKEVIYKEGNNSTHPRLFARWKIENNAAQNELRPILLNMFKHYKSVRKNIFTEQAKKELAITPNPKEVTKVFKDLCWSKGSSWYLHGT